MRSSPLRPLPTVPGAAAPPAAEFTGREPVATTAQAAPRKPTEPLRLALDQPAEAPWADPRPDLVGDRCRWWVVLQAAYNLDLQLFGALYVLRQCGARLEVAGPADWNLRPEGPLPDWKIERGAELSEAEYADYRQRYLLPHRQALSQLLRAQAAAGIAHQPTPEFTGRSDTSASASPAPRKGAPDPAAQPALLPIASERGDL